MDTKVRHVRVPATETLQNQTDRETCFYFEQEESKEVNVEGRGHPNTRPLEGEQKAEVRRWEPLVHVGRYVLNPLSCAVLPDPPPQRLSLENSRKTVKPDKPRGTTTQEVRLVLLLVLLLLSLWFSQCYSCHHCFAEWGIVGLKLEHRRYKIDRVWTIAPSRRSPFGNHSCVCTLIFNSLR